MPLNTRVIPCLLLKEKGLVKTIGFKEPRYIGDPINAVRIFNTMEAHELVILDITATIEKRCLPLDLVKKVANECSMPFAVGGGIKDINTIKELLNMGAEKVVMNTVCAENPAFISEAANSCGSQSVVVSIDVKMLNNGSCEVFTHSGTRATGINPVDFALRMERMGAGELFLNSIDRDGTMIGYDIELIRSVTKAVKIPVIAAGGAGKLSDLADAVNKGDASAVAAGSLFVYYGKKQAVLISYPSQEDLEACFTVEEGS
ncbi:MAG: AglZ/HisF2 family acetamidino modification protein [SAR202 cluster bacterium]|nr:AglZ/HisF2 family acetamidino modification protein [SAR202 cluster bacterium]